MTKHDAYQLGIQAEVEAAHFLERLGYRILARRFRSKAGEIDVIACGDDTLIIVEVKARKKNSDGLWAVTPTKQRRLARAAEAVLTETELLAGLGDPAKLGIRFDVIVISQDAEPLHMPNAWYIE